MDKTHFSSSHHPQQCPPHPRFCLGICCRSLARSHWCLLSLHHAQPWLLDIKIWISACERERVGWGRKLMLLEIDLDFCVCVRENEKVRQRILYYLVSDYGVVGYCIWYLRKCKDGKENKRNSRLKKKIIFFIFVLSINIFSFFV